MNYSKVVSLISKLTVKNTPWTRGTEQHNAFQGVKDVFTSAPILQHFDYEKAIVVETNAADYFSTGVLSQPDDKGVPGPLTFFSKKHSPAECT